MKEYWSINDIQNKILPDKITVGQCFVCRRYVDGEPLYFTIVDIREGYYWWEYVNKFGEIVDKSTDKIKIETPVGMRMETMHKLIKLGSYKKIKLK